MNEVPICERCNVRFISDGESYYTHSPNECLVNVIHERDKLKTSFLTLSTREKKLAEESFVPGHFRCAKCNFYLISKTLYMKSGNVGANNKPTECSNGCGPMWRVSWRDHAKDLGERLDKVLSQGAGDGK